MKVSSISCRKQQQMLPSDLSQHLPLPSLPHPGPAEQPQPWRTTAAAPSGGFSRGDWSNWGLPRASLWVDGEIPEIHEARLNCRVSERKRAETTLPRVKMQCLGWLFNPFIGFTTRKKNNTTKKCKNLAPSEQAAFRCSRKQPPRSVQPTKWPLKNLKKRNIWPKNRRTNRHCPLKTKGRVGEQCGHEAVL